MKPTFLNNAFKITTSRLVLRCYKMQDVTAFKKLIEDNKTHLSPWMPWIKEEPTSFEKKYDFLRNWIGQFYKNEDFMYGVFLPSGELIGSTGLHTRRGKDTLEIGYWLSEAHINKGYATELSYVLTKIAFQHIDVKKVEIHNDIRNTLSARIPEKLNFTKDFEYTTLEKSKNGKYIKHAVWVLFKENFRPEENYKSIEAFDALGKGIEH